ncbi:hypothetical protein MGG_07995 [Pyricularia oryzae 70-15]|uniref:C2H2-type domain-containing protein n=1 Tax=Pyricularia oryzae (strain 70-15 / ATCC MYA-4617 / FGSC 8958) TaxID=242507 RepID=G4MX41_PYRO7|nr:uncharacterized protein MGG_07995 [Pyricularia oryzae 70-15]EHA55139.1 hypothetical protein MGG_07995 [Pyricularia oryzae 70-15]
MVLAQPFHVWILFLTSAIALPTQIHHSAIQARDTDGLDTNSGQHQNAANPNSIKTLRAGTEPHKYPLKDAKVVELLRDPTLQFTKHYYCPHCKDGPMPTTDKVYQHIETHDPPLNTQTYVKGEDTKISFEKIKAKNEADTRIRDMKKNPCRLSGTRPSAQATSRKLRGRVQVAQHGGPRTTGGRLVPVRLSELAVTSRVMCCTSSPRGLPIAARARPSLPSLGGRHGRWVLGAEFAALPDYAGEAWIYHIREAGGE